MPYFSFQILDGTFRPDRREMELPCLRDAYVEAITTAGQAVKDDGMNLLIGAPWQMEVTDEQGKLLLTLNFSASIAPH